VRSEKQRAAANKLKSISIGLRRSTLKKSSVERFLDSRDRHRLEADYYTNILRRHIIKYEKNI